MLFEKQRYLSSVVLFMGQSDVIFRQYMKFFSMVRSSQSISRVFGIGVHGRMRIMGASLTA